MSAQILDGKLLAAKLKDDLKGQLAALKSKTGASPRLVSVMVGNDPGTKSYVAGQQKAAQSIGVNYDLMELPAESRQDDVISTVVRLNADPTVTGIILNKPMPAAIDFSRCSEAILPAKDVEGMNTANLGHVLMGTAGIWPCTAAAAIELLKSSGVPLAGKEAVVLGRSEIVGRPVALMLLKEDCTVTVCHSKTRDLQAHLGRADIVIAAIGKPLFVKGEWIKPGAVVIDVGINAQDGKIVGDLDYAGCLPRASFITPVPGGVGPVTSVILMKNALYAVQNAQISGS